MTYSDTSQRRLLTDPLTPRAPAVHAAFKPGHEVSYAALRPGCGQYGLMPACELADRDLPGRPVAGPAFNEVRAT